MNIFNLHALPVLQPLIWTKSYFLWVVRFLFVLFLPILKFYLKKWVFLGDNNGENKQNH